MDSTALHTFLTVAQLGSFTEAAEKLYLSQSAVSKRIAALEQELNVPVVTAHSVVLWKVLKILGLKEPLPGFGKLLSEYL